MSALVFFNPGDIVRVNERLRLYHDIHDTDDGNDTSIVVPPGAMLLLMAVRPVKSRYGSHRYSFLYDGALVHRTVDMVTITKWTTKENKFNVT